MLIYTINFCVLKIKVVESYARKDSLYQYSTIQKQHIQAERVLVPVPWINIEMTV